MFSVSNEGVLIDIESADQCEDRDILQVVSVRVIQLEDLVLQTFKRIQCEENTSWSLFCHETYSTPLVKLSKRGNSGFYI